MNKETMKKVCTVIIAICAIVLMFGLIDMLFSALSTDDLVAVSSISGESKKVLLLGKWTMLALCFVIIAAVVISVLNYFGKNRSLCFLTGGLYIFIALMAVAFAIAVYIVGKGELSASTRYTSGALFCENYLKVAVASAVLGAYYTVCAVQSLKNKGGCENGGNV